MAKKKKPARLRNPRGQFQGVYGMTPREVEAWRNQEIRERQKEGKAKDEALRKTGQKSGRPKGGKRLEREAERETRREEISRQRAERKSRAAKKGKGYRLPPLAKRTGRRGVAFKPAKIVRAGIEKTVFRFLGAAQWPDAQQLLRKLPPGTSVWTQIGTGYGVRGKWAGSRLVSPAEASHWLQGIGAQYSKKMFPHRRRDALWTEIIAYRKVKNAKPRKTKRAKGGGGKKKRR